ncbi:hypothetical protein BDZ91DRAFT_762336 [Kalaharituber pfeilii]|nr:hypothetical protein BDZ91DRAFT_762336 [Kalaharituber pfeilii]
MPRRDTRTSALRLWLNTSIEPNLEGPLLALAHQASGGQLNFYKVNMLFIFDIQLKYSRSRKKWYHISNKTLFSEQSILRPLQLIDKTGATAPLTGFACWSMIITTGRPKRSSARKKLYSPKPDHPVPPSPHPSAAPSPHNGPSPPIPRA